jgi:ribosome-associated translation inhibitor RaiA
MKIIINTDKTIAWDERHEEFFTSQISEELGRFQSDITRIEAHVSDENGNKSGVNDIRCVLEARLEGKQPFAVSCQADNVEIAVLRAIDKLKASLETKIGRMANH